ncbi:MAG: hypothetical protein MZV64_14385 [Ignavibacteriales bacterium]|nr:hypothetical protein [Ignavibacteriales bacterium]
MSFVMKLGSLKGHSSPALTASLFSAAALFCLTVLLLSGQPLLSLPRSCCSRRRRRGRGRRLLLLPQRPADRPLRPDHLDLYDGLPHPGRLLHGGLGPSPDRGGRRRDRPHRRRRGPDLGLRLGVQQRGQSRLGEVAGLARDGFRPDRDPQIRPGRRGPARDDQPLVFPFPDVLLRGRGAVVLPLRQGHGPPSGRPRLRGLGGPGQRRRQPVHAPRPRSPRRAGRLPGVAGRPRDRRGPALGPVLQGEDAAARLSRHPPRARRDRPARVELNARRRGHVRGVHVPSPRASLASRVGTARDMSRRYSPPGQSRASRDVSPISSFLVFSARRGAGRREP